MRAKTFQHPGAASLLVSLGAFLAVSTAGAQPFSDWSTPVNLNQLPNQQQPRDRGQRDWGRGLA